MKPRLVFKSRDLEDSVDVYVSGVKEAGRRAGGGNDQIINENWNWMEMCIVVIQSGFKYRDPVCFKQRGGNFGSMTPNLHKVKFISLSEY